MLTVYNKYYLHITLVSLLPACLPDRQVFLNSLIGLKRQN